MEQYLSEKKSSLIFTLLCILTILLYTGMLNYPILTNDDTDFFTKYPEILSLSWKNTIGYFFSYHVGLYQPLTVLTFALNYHFSGTTPFPLHLVNLVFHLANVLLVFLLFKKLFHKPAVALIISFLFAVHPMNVEAITWVSARSSVMYTSFYLLSVLFYLKYISTKPTLLHLLLSCLFFILSLFCKVQAVTLPFILVLMNYFTGRKINRKGLIEMLPFVMLSVLFVVIAFRNTLTFRLYTHSHLGSFTIIDQIFLNGRALFFYLQKFILPIDLSAVYAFPVKTNGWLPVEYYLSTLFFIIFFLAVVRFRKIKYVVFGAGIFLFSVSINLPINSLRSVVYADRYAYFPYLGLAVIVGCAFQAILDNDFRNKNLAIRFITVCFILFGLFISYQTWERNKKWENDLTLTTDIIEKNPPVSFIAKIYRKRANYLAKHGLVAESVTDYAKAIGLDPDDTYAYIGRAYAFIRLNRFNEALPDLDKSIENNPGRSILYANRAMVRLNTGDEQGAWSDCNSCLQLDSTNAEAYNYKAIVKYRLSDFQGAQKELFKAIRFNSQYAEAYKNLGIVLFRMDDREQACRYWSMASRLGDRQAAQYLKTNCTLW